MNQFVEYGLMDRRLVFLLHRASRAATAHANARLAAGLDVSIAQLATLSLVAGQPSVTPTELAGVLELNKSAVSSMLERLVRAKLVAREANPRDGRGWVLRVTHKGEQVTKRAAPLFRGVMLELTRGFTDAEIEVVLRFLNHVVSLASAGSASRTATREKTRRSAR